MSEPTSYDEFPEGESPAPAIHLSDYWAILLKHRRMIAGALVAAAGLFALGEGLRRGARALRLVQVGLMMVITVVGVVSLVTLLTGHVSGSLVFTTAIELTYPPWLIWRLLDGETAAWFALSREQRRAPLTTGWKWIAVLAVWAVVWGVLVAWAESV